MPTAVPTLKPLAASVGFTLDRVDALAFVAGLTCVCRIDQHQRNTQSDTLVGQELAQLEECPTVRTPSFNFGSWLLVCPFSDARQVFNRNAPTVRFGLLDKAMAYGVVDVGLEPSFSARQPLLKLPHPTASTSCASRGFPLKLRPLFSAFVTKLGQLLSTVGYSLRGVCNINASKVNPQTAIYFIRFGRFGLDLNLDMVGAIFTLHQRCGSGLLSLKQMPLVVADGKRDMFAPVHQSQTHYPLLFDQSKDSLIVLDACWGKALNESASQLGCLAVGGNPSKCLLGKICRKAEQGAGFVVKTGLHPQSVTVFSRDSLIDPRASICKYLECDTQLAPCGLHQFSRLVESRG